MWIKRITLKNFQSHSNSTIELSPKINVFLGRGNRGKSAIIRALIWVFFNEPQGDAFIRKGENIAKVSITLDDGNTVIREKGKGINKYILITKDGERKEYVGFGRDVPEDIKKVLRVKPLPIENGRKLSPQIKEQMDSLYLLDETPSVIHTTLLTISGGHIIDEAIKSLLTDLSKIQRREKEILKEIENLNYLLKDYEGIEEIRKKLFNLKNIVYDLKKLESRRERLVELKERLKNLKIKIKKLKKELNVLDKIEELNSTMSEIEISKKSLNELKRIKRRYMENRIRIEEFNRVYKILDKTILREETIKNIDDLKQKLVFLTNIKGRLKKIKEKEEEWGREIERVDKVIDEYLTKYVSTIGKEGVCPVCLRELDENLMNRVKDNIKRLWR